MSFAAVLDTSVLFPMYLRDTLLRVAEAGLYRPLWSADILAELRRRLVASITAEGAERVLTRMRAAFPEAEVRGYEPVTHTLDLPDPGDRHILAAAIRGGADVIVTRNVRDFPEARLARYGLDVQSPDAFLLERFDEAPDGVLGALEAQAAAYRRPAMTVGELVADLGGTHNLTDFAAAVMARLQG